MAKILVLGAINRDIVVGVDEFPRKGRLSEGHWHGDRLGGGAANTAVGLANLGHQVTLIGCVGTDDYGQKSLAELQHFHVDTLQIQRTPGPSSRALIILENTADRTIIVCGGALLETVTLDLWKKDFDVLYVAIPRRGFVPLLESAPAGVTVFATFPPHDTLIWPAHVLIGSESELSEPIQDTRFEAFYRKSNSMLKGLIVTQAERGAVCYGTDKTIRVPAEQIEPVDTTGAGDALAAGVIDGLVNGLDMEEALRYGVRWGTDSTRVLQSIPAPPPRRRYS